MIRPEQLSLNPVSKSTRKPGDAKHDLDDWLEILSASRNLGSQMSDATRDELIEGLDLAEAAIRRALAERKTSR